MNSKTIFKWIGVAIAAGQLLTAIFVDEDKKLDEAVKKALKEQTEK